MWEILRLRIRKFYLFKILFLDYSVRGNWKEKEHMEAEQSRSAIYPTTNDVNNLIRWCGALDEQDESIKMVL